MIRSRTKQRNPLVTLLVSAAVFLIATGLAIYESGCQVRLALYGIKTHATAIHVERSGRHRIVTFHFTDESGAVINVKNISGTGRPEVGEAFPIVYLPDNPEIVAVQGIKGCTFLFISLILVILGGLMLVGALSEVSKIVFLRK